MPRQDISERLIHFTSGHSEEDAFGALCSIIDDSSLIGGNQFIRGHFNCVCFSEAPLTHLENGLINPNYYSRYSPFGIIVEKLWLYKQGGRPVIYQSGAEYDELPESHKWRHVRYEPDSNPPIDFTWEREWRIRTGRLPLNPSTASIIVPTARWANELLELHRFTVDETIYSYSQILDEDEARFWFDEPYEWHIITLQK